MRCVSHDARSGGLSAPERVSVALTVLLTLGGPFACEAASGQQAAEDSARASYEAAVGLTELGTLEAFNEAIDLFKNAGALYATQANKAGEASSLSWIGTIHGVLGGADSAIVYTQAAVTLALESQSDSVQGLVFVYAGRTHYVMGQQDSAVHYLKAAGVVLERGDPFGLRASRLNILAAIFDDTGPPDSAASYYRQAYDLALEAGDLATAGITLSNLGVVMETAGRPDSAIGYYDRAVSLFEEIEQPRLAATVLGNIGSLHNQQGRPDSALVYHERAVAGHRTAGNAQGIATSLNNVGVIVSRSDPDSALSLYHSALSIATSASDLAGRVRTLQNIGIEQRRLGRPDSSLFYHGLAVEGVEGVGSLRLTSSVMAGMGMSYRSVGRPALALEYYQRALDAADAAGFANGLMDAIGEIAGAHQDLGNADTAVVLYRQALEIAESIEAAEMSATLTSNLANLFALSGQPDSAIAYYESALETDRDMSNRQGEAITLHNLGKAYGLAGQADSALIYLPMALERLRELGDNRNVGRTLYDLGRVYHRLGEPDLAEASALYAEAAEVVSEVASRGPTDADRVGLAELDVDLYEDWTLAELARTSSRSREDAEYAGLAVTELGRAQGLLELAASAAVLEIDSNALEASGRRLATEVTETGSSVLSYVVTKDTLVTWFMAPPGTVATHRTPIARDSLQSLVARLQRSMGGPSVATLGIEGLPEPADGTGVDDQGLLQELGDLLLPPEFASALAGGGDVVVVPHHSLGLVPFAALPFGTAGGTLGQEVRLRYAPSLRFLSAVSSREATPVSGSTSVIVGNPETATVLTAEGESRTMPSLPGAQAEAGAVALLLGGTAVLGGDASESHVKAQLPTASVVHLATHGFAYSHPELARSSFVALSPSPGDDGRLTMDEVMQELPDIVAELVVLSACESGLGDLRGAEGTVGLQRAFLAKGARSLLVSQWKVSDTAARLLMERFYFYWHREGDEKAEALRKAQTDVSQRPEFAHPRHWAAFQLVGAN